MLKTKILSLMNLQNNRAIFYVIFLHCSSYTGHSFNGYTVIICFSYLFILWFEDLLLK